MLGTHTPHAHGLLPGPLLLLPPPPLLPVVVVNVFVDQSIIASPTEGGSK